MALEWVRAATEECTKSELEQSLLTLAQRKV